MNKHLIISVVLIVVALGGGFFAGMQYQKSKIPSFAGANGQFRGRFGQGVGGAAGARPTRGEVLSISNTGMTVKLSDGSSKIVIVSPSTMFMKSTAAVSTDVKSGDTVMVLGTTNSDGSVTAQNVAINPPTGGQGRPSIMPSGAAQ